jgi:hypothetical protein
MSGQSFDLVASLAEIQRDQGDAFDEIFEVVVDQVEAGFKRSFHSSPPCHTMNLGITCANGKGVLQRRACFSHPQGCSGVSISSQYIGCMGKGDRR